MSKLIKNNLGNFLSRTSFRRKVVRGLVVLLVFLIVMVWIFSGWPKIWEKPSVPPEIQEVKAATEDLHADGAGTSNNWGGVDATNLASNDNDVTKATGTSKLDFLYATIANHVTCAGTVNSVTAKIYAFSSTDTYTLAIGMYDGTNTIYDVQWQPSIDSGAYTYREYTSTTNPSGGAWTCALVDSLEVVIDPNKGGAPAGDWRVTELWITVNTKPTISALGVNDSVLSEADVGVDKFVVTIDFSEAMDTGTAATVVFDPTVDTSLTNCGGVWSDSDTYTYTCDVADANVEQAGIDIDVSGAKDVATNTMDPDTTSGVDKFEIDTIAPTVTDAYITVTGATGTGGAFKNGDTQVYTWDDSATGDNNSDTISTVTFNGSSFAAADSAKAGSESAGIWTATGSAMDSQDDTGNTITVTVVDDAGNSTGPITSSTSYTIDTIVPDISEAAVSPNNGTAVVNDIITATLTAGETGLVVDGTCTINNVDVSGSLVDNENNTYTLTYTVGGGDGDWTAGNLPLSCTLKDSAGNTDTVSAWTDGNTLAGDTTGVLTVDIVDSNGDSVVSPSMAMDAVTFSFSYQTVYGTFWDSNQKIRVENTTGSPEWTLDIAANAGPTGYWDGPQSDYDFNDPTANAGDGGDDDVLGGQLTIDATGGTLGGTCSATGITKGSDSFEEGVTNSFPLLTAGSSADTGCYWDLTGVSVSQTIPAKQPADDYTIYMTLTVTAS